MRLCDAGERPFDGDRRQPASLKLPHPRGSCKMPNTGASCKMPNTGASCVSCTKRDLSHCAASRAWRARLPQNHRGTPRASIADRKLAVPRHLVLPRSLSGSATPPPHAPENTDDPRPGHLSHERAKARVDRERMVYKACHFMPNSLQNLKCQLRHKLARTGRTAKYSGAP
jgi:hypothetical protein